MAACTNTLISKPAAGQVCNAFGIKLCTNPQVVFFAKNAGYDSLFIDMEHSTLSIDDVSQICAHGLLSGVTPFVRVPYQCGNGFVQRVLDGGAMGVIFPHIHSADDAKAAVDISKYPPQGCRSMTGQLPAFCLRPTPQTQIISESNANLSSVIVMIETKDSIENIEKIAAVEGVDVLLIGSNDLSIELGVPGDFKASAFRSALEAVSRACRDNGKIMGLAGIYENYELQNWAINELGVRFMLCTLDAALIATGAAKSLAAVPTVA